MLVWQPNPHLGKPNSDIVKPWLNRPKGSDINAQVSREYVDNRLWLSYMSEADAALYEAPFEYVPTLRGQATAG